MDRRLQLELDHRLRLVAEVARLLPALTARNAPAERGRLLGALARGERLEPKWTVERGRVERRAWRALAEARALAPQCLAGDYYLARLDELELELVLMESLGDTRQVRPIAARRFGTGDREVQLGARRYRIADIADVLLAEVDGSVETPSVPADAPSGPSLGGWVRTLARLAGLDVEVKVEPRLVANAAAGDRTVYVRDARFGEREARRLAVHEVLGHLVAAANGRSQPLALLAIGTAGAFADQEGLCLTLEELHGFLDGQRVRTLAGRVVATDAMHRGASFDDTVRLLHTDHGFAPADALALGERAYRGGGVARDAGYLYGWLRVRKAVNEGDASVDELRLGKVGLNDLPMLRQLRADGQIREGVYRPSLARSREATQLGTSASTSPPSFAASLTRFEET
ncbi:MAG: tyrosine/phenylalanine carboxypeptidase domain-containing protein [Myxococcota bacterium]